MRGDPMLEEVIGSDWEKNEDYFSCLICIFGIQIDFLYSLKILIAFFYFYRSMYCTVGMILGTE
jgi:hypothetical protein